MLPVLIERQPDDITCGPTCLAAVYHYYGEQIGLSEIIRTVRPVQGGGTLAANLGVHALERGYSATIYTYNLLTFDPTWFRKGIDLREKLLLQAKIKNIPKLNEATEAYINFLDLGGRILGNNLTTNLIHSILERGCPIIAGLSSTYLYQCARESEYEDGVSVEDDVGGTPTGHFVVLSGYNEKEKMMIADPYGPPETTDLYYAVNPVRLINSILLGIVTYDANLLVIEPMSKSGLLPNASTFPHDRCGQKC